MSEKPIRRSDIVDLLGERVNDDAWAERSVAEVERAAAERAWDESESALKEYAAQSASNFMLGFKAESPVKRPVNPYRREETE